MLGGREARENIIVQYLPLVKYVVGRLAIGLPHFLTSEDMISYGVVGLIDAFSKFDHTKKVQFKSYAQFRIRGAILDSLIVG